MPRLLQRNMGKSLALNGTTSYFTLPFTPSTTAFSIGFWFKTASVVANSRIVDWQDAGPSGGFAIQVGASGRVSFDVRNAGTLQSSLSIPYSSEWTHIVASYSNNNALLYVNGVLAGADTSVTMTAPTQTLTVGRRSTGATNYFTGLIDDFVFVNGRQVTAQESADMFSSGYMPIDATTMLNFNDNATDQTGNGNNATLTSTSYSTEVAIKPRQQSAGRISSRNMMASLSFNGTNSSVMATKIPNLHLGCTFSAWFKYKPGTPPACIVENSQDTNNRLVMMYQAGFLRAGYWNGSAYTFKNSSGITPNTWYHGVFTWDGTNTKLYLNGVEQLLTTQGPSSSMGGQLAIGMSGDGSGFRPFLGNIARVMFWNRALTQEEVLSIYERGAVPSSGLVGKYDLNEGAGSTAYDTSGAGNNGTISNGAFSGDTAYWRRQEVNRNLIYNGDFEYAPPFVAATNAGGRWIDGTAAGSTTNDIFGWACQGGGNLASSEWGFDSTEKYGGTYSMKLRSLDATGLCNVTIYNDTTSTASRAIPALPSTSYTLTARVKTSTVATNAAYIRIRTLDGSKLIISTSISNRLSGTNDWTLCTVTYTTEATTRFIVPILTLDPGQAGTAWFDDIELKPTTPTSRQLIS